MTDIIIVTYNAKNKLKTCLDSIEKYTKDIKYLLTIVNNNSSDGTRTFLNKYRRNKKLTIINSSKNLGFSGGANVALKNTSGKFVVFLDDDTEVTKNWLKQLYKQITLSSKIGIVGCKIVLPDNRIFAADYWAKPLCIVGVGERDKGQRDYIKECDILVGTCWITRRALVEKIGYFDEQFFPSQHEDADYCLRARLAGYKIIYNGNVKIIHHHLFREKKQFKLKSRKFLKKWKNALEKFPLKDSHPVNRCMAYGYDYLRRSKYEKALTEFKKVESFDKRFTDPLFLYRGLALKRMGDHLGASSEFKKAIEILSCKKFGHKILSGKE